MGATPNPDTYANLIHNYYRCFRVIREFASIPRYSGKIVTAFLNAKYSTYRVFQLCYTLCSASPRLAWKGKCSSVPCIFLNCSSTLTRRYLLTYTAIVPTRSPLALFTTATDFPQRVRQESVEIRLRIPNCKQIEPELRGIEHSRHERSAGRRTVAVVGNTCSVT